MLSQNHEVYRLDCVIVMKKRSLCVFVSVFFINSPRVFLPPPVQLLSSAGGVGDVAPHADRRGSVRHRQHLQLPQTHLPLHRQLPPGATADLTGEDAAGHPQVPLHLLPGEASSSVTAGRVDRPQSHMLTVLSLRFSFVCVCLLPNV